MPGIITPTPVEKAEHEHELHVKDCNIHGPSQTPLIDAALQTSSTRDHLLSISQALVALAEKNACTRCAAHALSSSLLELTAEIKTAAKTHKRECSRAERRAWKAEMRELNRAMKKDARLARRHERFARYFFKNGEEGEEEKMTREIEQKEERLDEKEGEQKEKGKKRWEEHDDAVKEDFAQKESVGKACSCY